MFRSSKYLRLVQKISDRQPPEEERHETQILQLYLPYLMFLNPQPTAPTVLSNPPASAEATIVAPKLKTLGHIIEFLRFMRPTQCSCAD